MQLERPAYHEALAPPPHGRPSSEQVTQVLKPTEAVFRNQERTTGWPLST